MARIKYPIIILIGVSVFVLIASTSVSSGWLWLLGVLETIALSIVTFIWWSDLGDERKKSAWQSKAVAGFGAVLFVGMVGMFMLAPTIHQWAKSNREEAIVKMRNITGKDWNVMTLQQRINWVEKIILGAKSPTSNHYVQELNEILSKPSCEGEFVLRVWTFNEDSENYLDPLITSEEWNLMFLLSKKVWMERALSGIGKVESDLQPADYYIQKLDAIFNDPDNVGKLPAWELTAFTSGEK